MQAQETKKKQPSWSLAEAVLIEPWKFKDQQLTAAVKLCTAEGFRILMHVDNLGREYSTLHHPDDGDPQPILNPSSNGNGATPTMYAPAPPAYTPLPTPAPPEQGSAEEGYRKSITLAARLWGDVLGVEIEPWEVASCTAMLKLAHLVHCEAGNGAMPDNIRRYLDLSDELKEPT